MTLYLFNSADEMEQIEALWNGVFIGQGNEGDFLIECRQTDMRSFKNPDLFQPYPIF